VSATMIKCDDEAEGQICMHCIVYKLHATA
jgi:hypothetical protein